MDILFLWLHLLGIATWLGGLVIHLFAVLPAVMAIVPQARGAFMNSYGSRFPTILWIGIGVIWVSGLSMIAVGIGFDGLFEMGHYTGVLLTKITIALVITSIALYVTFVLNPKMHSAQRSGSPGGGPSPIFLKLGARMIKITYIQIGLGLIMLLFGVMLQSCSM